MKEHCYEPIVKVEYGWRVDYNPCRHYNTLYITIDTKELLFNGVAYNRFNIQDINYQNGTIYINVGNRLLSCKLPNASKECAGLMSPLDKQQLDYIFQLLLDGIDSINFSKNVSWGIHLDQNNDKLILVFVNPITSFNDLLNIGETENLVSALVLKPITTLEELRNLRNNDDCFISAKLLKELIEYNNLRDVPEETYLVTLFINDKLVNQQNIVSGGNYEYIYAGLLNGYELVNSSSLAVSINGNIIKLNNIQQSIEIYLVRQAIEYGISEEGYDSSIWSKTGFRNKYTINDEFVIEYTLLNPDQYLSSSVKFNEEPITSSENTYTIRINQGTTGPIEIVLSTIRKGSAEILTIPEVVQNLIYNGSEQDLITGGTASNGDMRYAVTADNITIAPSKTSSDWTSYIPEKTNAGTYKVWYYAKGKNGYSDSNINHISITISKATPELTINNPSSTTIADGLNTIINVISNIPGNLTLTTANGTGWSATSDSESTVKSTHIITVTNNSYPNPGSISEGGIRATFTPNNDNYEPITNRSVLNQEITLSPAIYTITWIDNGATTLHEGGSIKVNSGDTVTLPTIEPKREYSITWDNNGGSGSAGGLDKATYTFKGWFTDPSSGERINSDTKPNGNKTYYAQWTAPASIISPTTIPTRTGYTFKGWAISSSATTPNITIPTNGDITYYAIWEKNIIYYWYVGTTTPTDPTNSVENTGLNKWTVLPDSQVSVKIYKEDENLVEHIWYLAAPASRQFVTSVNGTQVGGWRTSTISIDGVEYTVWTTMAEADTVNVTLAKLN